MDFLYQPPVIPVPDYQLSTPHGTATVLAIEVLNQPTTVYNIEVHGEHVYEVGELGVLVHNACEEVLELARGQVAMGFMTRAGKLITITTATAGGHADLILTISGLTARVRNGTAVAFTVMKNSEGTLVAMGSGQFPIEGGLTLAMKQLIYGLVR